MTFLDPAFLWGFGLVAPLVAIYLLKVRPRRTSVTAYFLWDEIFVEKKASALFRRLRDLFSLLIMLAALSALVFAAARPRLSGTATADLIVIIDNSASMSAEMPGGGTRLDAARREAHRLLASVSGSRRGAVATVSDAVSMRCFLTDDRRALGRAIDAVSATALPTRPDALRSLEGFEQRADKLRVVLLSDAAAPWQSLPAGVDLIRIAGGEPVENAGLIAADLVKLAGSEELRLFFRIGASASLAGAAAEVSLSQSGQPVRIVPVALVAGPNPPVVVAAAGEAGQYTLRLRLVGRGPDAIAGDDVVSLVARQPDPIRVSVSDEARYFFENAVLAFDRSEGLIRLAGGDEADLALSHGRTAGEATPRLGSIVFGPVGGTRWAASAGDLLDTPVPRLVARDHPAFRFVPVESLRFNGARQATVPPGAVVLVEDQSGTPLVWQLRAAGEAGVAGLVFNMQPDRGDFFLSPYFPLIIRGAAAYLGGRVASVQSVYPTGTAIEIPDLAPGATASVTYEAVDGKDSEPAQAGTVAFGETFRLEGPGLYRVATPRPGVLAAGMLHRDETIVAESLDLAAPQDLPRGAPVWVQLTILAILLLVAEEALYHRRRVG